MQVDSIIIRAESAPGFHQRLRLYHVMNRLQMLLSISTCATTPRRPRCSCRRQGLADNACHVITHILDSRLSSELASYDVEYSSIIQIMPATSLNSFQTVVFLVNWHPITWSSSTRALSVRPCGQCLPRQYPLCRLSSLDLVGIL